MITWPIFLDFLIKQEQKKKIKIKQQLNISFIKKNVEM